MRINTIASFLTAIGFTSLAFAADPPRFNGSIPLDLNTIQSHRESFPLNPPSTSPAISTSDLYKVFDFDLKYHLPPRTTPLHPKLPETLHINPLTIPHSVPTTELQTWKSFNFNGYQVLLRPAIYNQTPAIIKDSTTGQTFYFQDPVSTLGIKDIHQNLIDDRPKSK
jgi:hypothetical protein